MKDPCDTCPPRIKKNCNKELAVCKDWEEWLFYKSKGRNATQMRITQYTEREE